MGGNKDKYLNEIVYEFDYTENAFLGGNGLDEDNITESRKQELNPIPIKSVFTVKVKKIFYLQKTTINYLVNETRQHNNLRLD